MYIHTHIPLLVLLPLVLDSLLQLATLKQNNIYKITQFNMHGTKFKFPGAHTIVTYGSYSTVMKLWPN